MNPDFPGFPSPLTTGEIDAGLPAAAAASALLGKGGAGKLAFECLDLLRSTP